MPITHLKLEVGPELVDRYPNAMNLLADISTQTRQVLEMAISLQRRTPPLEEWDGLQDARLVERTLTEVRRVLDAYVHIAPRLGGQKPL